MKLAFIPTSLALGALLATASTPASGASINLLSANRSVGASQESLDEFIVPSILPGGEDQATGRLEKAGTGDFDTDVLVSGRGPTTFFYPQFPGATDSDDFDEAFGRYDLGVRGTSSLTSDGDQLSLSYDYRAFSDSRFSFSSTPDRFDPALAGVTGADVEVYPEFAFDVVFEVEEESRFEFSSPFNLTSNGQADDGFAEFTFERIDRDFDANEIDNPENVFRRDRSPGGFGSGGNFDRFDTLRPGIYRLSGEGVGFTYSSDGTSVSVNFGFTVTAPPPAAVPTPAALPAGLALLAGFVGRRRR